METENIDVGLAPDSIPKLTDWKNEPEVRALKQDLTNALSDHTLATQTIEEWLDLLHVTGKEKIKPKKGFSKVQPKLIRKHAEWRYATLAEPFLSSPDLFKVDPMTAEDLVSARQNELILNNQFNTKINKVKLINDYVRTAVNEGTVIIRVGWKYEEVEKVTEQVIFDYVIDNSESTNKALQRMFVIAEQYGVEELNKYFEPHEINAFRLSMENQVPYWFVDTGETAKFKETKVVKNHPEVEICDYRNTIIDPTCKGDLSKANFIIHSFETSLSSLKKEGDKYKNLDLINLNESSILSAPDSHRGEVQSFNYDDNARKRLLAYEYWGYWDIDGTGITKPIIATFVGNTMIRLEESPYEDGSLPFVLVQYLPTRGVYGEADAELLADNQRIMGAVTRGMIDLLGRSANSQQGMRKDALDLTNRKKFQDGDDYEFNPGVRPEEMVYMHKYPEIPASAQFMLQSQQMEAESMIGNKVFSSGITGAALGNTATGARGALDAAARRDLDILNRLASGLVEVARKVISMNKQFLEDNEIVRFTNDEFVMINRKDLEGHFDLRMTISTAEVDNQKAQELGFMLQTIGPNMDIEMTKLILSEIATLRKMPTLAKQIQAYAPQPDPLQQRKAELELMLLEAQIAETMANAQNKGANAQLNMSKVGTESVKQSNIQSQTDKNILDFVEQETGTKQERDLQKQGAQARANMELELLKSTLNNTSQSQA